MLCGPTPRALISSLSMGHIMRGTVLEVYCLNSCATSQVVYASSVSSEQLQKAEHTALASLVLSPKKKKCKHR